MAIKDRNIRENVDREPKETDEKKPDLKPVVESLIANSEVKNAHASGDGSYGRNDSSVPEVPGEEPKAEPPY